MLIVDRYVGWITIKGIVGALSGFVAITLMINVIGDLGHIHTGGPGLLDVFWQNILLLPRIVYELFPSAALVGTLISVGALSSNSELTAFRAAGVSRNRISFSVLMGASLVMLPVLMQGELVAPQSELSAQNYRAQVNGRQVSLGKAGTFWMQTETGILKGYGVVDEGEGGVQVSFHNMTLFQMDKKGRLSKRVDATEAVQSKGAWLLKNAKTTVFSEQGVKVEYKKELEGVELAKPEILASSAINPNALGIRDLIVQKNYLEQYKLDSSAYNSALWRRIAYPSYVLIMVLVGMPFVFGSMRNSSMGQRVFIGILVGLSYHIISRMIVNAGQVYHIPGWLAAFGPPLLLALISIRFLRKA